MSAPERQPRSSTSLALPDRLLEERDSLGDEDEVAGVSALAVVRLVQLAEERAHVALTAASWPSEAMVFLKPSSSSTSGCQPSSCLRAGDVGLPHLRIVHGKRLEDDLARGAREPDDRLRELEQRLLVRVAEVDGQMLVRLREQDDPADQVVHVAEAPRLRAVAEHGHGLSRRAPDRRNVGIARPSFGRILGPVGVEDPHDRRCPRPAGGGTPSSAPRRSASPRRTRRAGRWG